MGLPSTSTLSKPSLRSFLLATRWKVKSRSSRLTDTHLRMISSSRLTPDDMRAVFVTQRHAPFQFNSGIGMTVKRFRNYFVMQAVAYRILLMRCNFLQDAISALNAICTFVCIIFGYGRGKSHLV